MLRRNLSLNILTLTSCLSKTKIFSHLKFRILESLKTQHMYLMYNMYRTCLSRHSNLDIQNRVIVLRRLDVVPCKYFRKIAPLHMRLAKIVYIIYRYFVAGSKQSLQTLNAEISWRLSFEECSSHTCFCDINRAERLIFLQP